MKNIELFLKQDLRPRGIQIKLQQASLSTHGVFFCKHVLVASSKKKAIHKNTKITIEKCIFLTVVIFC